MKEKDVGKRKAGPRGRRAVHEAHVQGWPIPAKCLMRAVFSHLLPGTMSLKLLTGYSRPC